MVMDVKGFVPMISNLFKAAAPGKLVEMLHTSNSGIRESQLTLEVYVRGETATEKLKTVKAVWKTILPKIKHLAIGSEIELRSSSIEAKPDRMIGGPDVYIYITFTPVDRRYLVANVGGSKMNRKAALAELEKLASCSCGGETKTSRFEEGKPADPTKNMSEEDADTWWAKHDEHKDNFKTASGKYLMAGGGAGVTLVLSGHHNRFRAQKPDVSGWHEVEGRGVNGIRIPIENLTLASYEDSTTVRQAGTLVLTGSDLPRGYVGGISILELDNATVSSGFSRSRAPDDVEVTGSFEDENGDQYSFEALLDTSPAFKAAWDSLD